MGMQLHQTVALKQQQQLVMTPMLQQAINLLALSRLELIEEIHVKLESNPLLEREDSHDREASIQEAVIHGADPLESQERSEPDRVAEVSSDTQTANDIDWSQYLESYNSSAPIGRGAAYDPSEEGRDWMANLSEEESLQDYLLNQIGEQDWVEDDQRIAVEIIGNLNSQGFLKGEEQIEEIAIRLKVSVSHVERVLSMVQKLDPAGIAARDFAECLLIQLHRSGNTNPLAEKLVTHYLGELEKRNYQQIAREEEVDIEAVAEALHIVQGLDPRPARGFGGDDSVYITPDIYVRRVGDKLVIEQNDDGLPKLRVSQVYQKTLAQSAQGDAKSFAQEKMREAQWMIRSIYERQRTIYRVMESILKFQRPFFEEGIDHLRPLVLREVAEDIDMHESTVSRVTTNKYVHTPQGIFELKFFFNSSIGRSDGDDVASVSVKHRIKQLIVDEDSKKPYSDQTLVNLLKKEGITIARRTVAKYRESMGILSSSQRRKIL